MPLLTRAVRRCLVSTSWRPSRSSHSVRLKPLAPVVSASARTFTCSAQKRTRQPSAIAQRLPDPEAGHQRLRDFNLEGKVFVVTGGGRGLGLTLAEVLVEAGGKGTRNSALSMPLKT